MQAQKKLLPGLLVSALLLNIPSQMFARCTPHKEVRRNVMIRENLEDLQRRVNDGDDPWRVEARSVALEELFRHVPALRWVDTSDINLKSESQKSTRAVFVWTRGDQRVVYRITLRRHRYLLPLAGDGDGIVWVAERTEITTRI